MNRKGNVYFKDSLCGVIQETDEGYSFTYEKEYLDNVNAEPISQTLPLASSTYQSKTFFPFFDGLIPEGWLLDIAEKNWKIPRRDRMGLLLTLCKDCIGAVSISNISKEL